MKPFNLYVHKHTTDVALMPIKTYFIPEKNGYKVKCQRFNIVNPKNVFLMHDGVDQVFIKKEDINNWRLYEPIQKN